MCRYKVVILLEEAKFEASKFGVTVIYLYVSLHNRNRLNFICSDCVYIPLCKCIYKTHVLLF